MDGDPRRGETRRWRRRGQVRAGEERRDEVRTGQERRGESQRERRAERRGEVQDKNGGEGNGVCMFGVT